MTNLVTGFVLKTIDMGEKTYRYSVWIPHDYTPRKRWPAVLFLHGRGECGKDGQIHTTVGLGKAVRKTPARFPAIIVMPHMPIGMRWEGPMRELALATLEAACEEYSVDRRRIALTGLSLGGFGTWTLGAARAELFCALAPICGGGDPADAELLARTPIWCWHGDADSTIDVEKSREMVNAVRAAGGDVRYTELPDVGHVSWDAAYSDPEFISWLLSQGSD